jgi:hypothetical protein
VKKVEMGREIRKKETKNKKKKGEEEELCQRRFFSCRLYSWHSSEKQHKAKY